MSNVLRFRKRSLVVADSILEGVLSQAEKAAKSSSPVLLCGESGSGKELIAKFIHEKYRSTLGPFVSINCAAIPEGLLESEFFGYERGAFTGAISKKLGKFELAGQGTLLLDEISEMPYFLQAKLLRVLQEEEMDRLGSVESVPVQCRIVATTNRDPISLIQQGAFREDLYFRLNVVRIDCPPLRGRTAAISSLLDEFLRQACEKNGTPLKKVSSKAMDRLFSHFWPGNIRELYNVVERAVLFCDSDTLTESSFQGLENFHSKETPESLQEVEMGHIRQILSNSNGNRERAARRLGISSRTLRNKLKQSSGSGRAE